MNIEKKVFQLIISAMFFVVPVYGQHSELLSQYRNRALQYNQDMKAAEKNNDKAQFELGNAYLTGNGVEENDDIAMEWFEKAAENGNEKALKITGRRRK